MIKHNEEYLRQLAKGKVIGDFPPCKKRKKKEIKLLFNGAWMAVVWQIIQYFLSN